MKSNDITGGRYVGRDGSVREVLGRYADKIGVLKVDYVRVPGNGPRTCTVAAFARWAVSHAVATNIAQDHARPDADRREE